MDKKVLIILVKLSIRIVLMSLITILVYEYWGLNLNYSIITGIVFIIFWSWYIDVGSD